MLVTSLCMYNVMTMVIGCIVGIFNLLESKNPILLYVKRLVSDVCDFPSFLTIYMICYKQTIYYSYWFLLIILVNLNLSMRSILLKKEIQKINKKITLMLICSCVALIIMYYKHTQNSVLIMHVYDSYMICTFIVILLELLISLKTGYYTYRHNLQNLNGCVCSHILFSIYQTCFIEADMNYQYYLLITMTVILFLIFNYKQIYYIV